MGVKLDKEGVKRGLTFSPEAAVSYSMGLPHPWKANFSRSISRLYREGGRGFRLTRPGPLTTTHLFVLSIGGDDLLESELHLQC